VVAMLALVVFGIIEPAVLTPAERPVRLREGLFVCGDHRDTASIQGAMFSGRRCGLAVATTIGHTVDHG
jgi:hypothetical protein